MSIMRDLIVWRVVSLPPLQKYRRTGNEAPLDETKATCMLYFDSFGGDREQEEGERGPGATGTAVYMSVG